MLYETFDPPPQLAPYVRFFWALEAEVRPNQEFVHRSMADGCVEMVFHYRGLFDEIGVNGVIEASPAASIQAQSTRFRRFVTRESFGIFGVYLYPFAIPRLFAFPASDLTNIAPDLAAFLGAEGQRLGEQVAGAAGNSDRVKIVSDLLVRRLNERPRELPGVYRAVHAVLDTDGVINVAGLAGQHALSTRQFERRFKEMAGLSPKLYSRIARFQAATRHKLTGTRDLTNIAYACGYYDQSHFIKDFREFSGYTPKEYFWDEAEGTQYLNMSHSSNS